MIKKQGNKFVVTNKAGTKVLGTHGSKEKAQKQLAAIEISKAKHMHENKSFKAFRSTLNESEYSEVLTGYGNRSAHKDDAGLHHLQSAGALAGINAMLATIGKGTYLDPNEAFLKMKVRLNVVQLDFPWKPGSWSGGVGSFDIPVVQFGRVDGYDAQTGEIRFDGKANPTGGYTELNLHVDVELTPESLYVVSAKLTPSVPVTEEVEVAEDYQTPAREKEMQRKIQAQDDRADRAYTTKMQSPSEKVASRANKRLNKAERKVNALLARDYKEYRSPRTYGRGGKIVKRGSRAEVKEGAEQIDEAGVKFSRWNRNADWLKMAETYKKGTPVNIVLKDGNRVSGTLARWAAYDGGLLDGYIIYVKTPSSVVEVDDVTVKSIQWNNDPKTKISEGAEQIDELSKKTLGSYVRKAASDIAWRSADAEAHDAMMGAPGTSRSKLAKERKKIGQRKRGIGQAVSRLTKEEVEQIDEAGQAKLERLGKAYDKARLGARGVLKPENKKRLGDAYFSMRDKVLDKRKKRIEKGTFDKEKEVQARVAHNKKNYSKGVFGNVFGKKTVQEELVGGQKKLDLNKNKRLDAHDFAMLRAKKKAVSEAKKPMIKIGLNPTKKIGYEVASIGAGGKKTVEKSVDYTMPHVNRDTKKKGVNEAQMKQWTPRLDKLMANRDAVRSKPKKSILTQKVQDGKKMGAARPIAKYEG